MTDDHSGQDRTRVGVQGCVENDDAFRHLYQGQNYSPVFIMGPHRSGTTLLHQLLVLSGNFNFVNVYHCLRFDHIVANHICGNTETAKDELDQEIACYNMPTRVIDNVSFNADTPEEYSMVLDAAGKGLKLTKKTLPRFHDLCRKLQYVGSPDALLLLKNPWDVPSFLDVEQLVPHARYIFIHRHPIDTLNSTLKAVRKAFTEPNPYTDILSPTLGRARRNRLIHAFTLWATSPRSKGPLMQRLMAREAVRSDRYYEKNVVKIAPDRRMDLRYEDLCHQPSVEIARILSFLGMRKANLPDYDAEIKPRPRNLLPSIESALPKLNRQFQPMLERHGYSDG